MHGKLAPVVVDSVAEHEIAFCRVVIMSTALLCRLEDRARAGGKSQETRAPLSCDPFVGSQTWYATHSSFVCSSSQTFPSLCPCVARILASSGARGRGALPQVGSPAGSGRCKSSEMSAGAGFGTL